MTPVFEETYEQISPHTARVHPAIVEAPLAAEPVEGDIREEPGIPGGDTIKNIRLSTGLKNSIAGFCEERAVFR